MDEKIVQFVSITSLSPEKASKYLQLTEGNVESAVQLFLEAPNLDLDDHEPTTTASTQSQPGQTSSRPIEVEDEDDDPMQIESDDDVSGTYEQNKSRSRGADSAIQQANEGPSFEDDEAMARRLQEEMYAGGDMAGFEGVRAPMARTTETLVGPGANWTEEELNAEVAEQLARRRRPATRPGIFNQRSTQSVWDSNDASDPAARRRNLSRATGGASEQSSKSNLLAEMYRPPFEIISRLDWDAARDAGKKEEKWLLVNVQDPAIFDCQVLNRDIWKNPDIKETIKENFIFMQYNKDDPAGAQYIQYYFHALRDSQSAYPHIGIVDPRTGEQLKVWSGGPVPKPLDLLQQLHEFLDRYSLAENARNPVATRKSEKKHIDVDRMTEEEMLQMAMQNSLGEGAASRGGGDTAGAEDPDELTKSWHADAGKGKEKAPVPPAAAASADSPQTSAASEQPPTTNGSSTSISAPSPFALISSASPHKEPPASAPAGSTTRIQFRYSGGRVVRRFALDDRVRRLFEWLKASPLEDKEGLEFELVFMGKNLIDRLDETVKEVGLGGGTVMVEFSYD